MPWHRWEGADLILQVQVQPRASRDEFAGVVGDCLKVRITAAPVAGEANVRLISFLAQQFGTAKERVALLQGHKGKVKVIRIQAPTRTPAELELQLPGQHA